jgi:hypothetical protein
MPPDSLGHLVYRLQLQSPQELGMVMSEVSLGCFEEFCFGFPCELRPALTEGDPSMSSSCSHGGKHRGPALSRRFQIVSAPAPALGAHDRAIG